MDKNRCGQSGYDTLKLNEKVPQEWKVGIHWFFAWCYKFRKAKNCFNDFKLLIIPKIIIPNQISACIAYKSVPYKRHVMYFEEITSSCEFFCVLILYFIWKIFSNKYCQKWRVWKTYKKGTWPYRGLSIEEEGSKLLHTIN